MAHAAAAKAEWPCSVFDDNGQEFKEAVGLLHNSSLFNAAVQLASPEDEVPHLPPILPFWLMLQHMKKQYQWEVCQFKLTDVELGPLLGTSIAWDECLRGYENEETELARDSLGMWQLWSEECTMMVYHLDSIKAMNQFDYKFCRQQKWGGHPDSDDDFSELVEQCSMDDVNETRFLSYDNLQHTLSLQTCQFFNSHLQRRLTVEDQKSFNTNVNSSSEQNWLHLLPSAVGNQVKRLTTTPYGSSQPTVYSRTTPKSGLFMVRYRRKNEKQSHQWSICAYTQFNDEHDRNGYLLMSSPVQLGLNEAITNPALRHCIQALDKREDDHDSYCFRAISELMRKTKLFRLQEMARVVGEALVSVTVGPLWSIIAEYATSCSCVGVCQAAPRPYPDAYMLPDCPSNSDDDILN